MLKSRPLGKESLRAKQGLVEEWEWWKCPVLNAGKVEKANLRVHGGNNQGTRGWCRDRKNKWVLIPRSQDGYLG